MSAKQTERDWLESLTYLPKFFRDFHDQKDIFKWIWDRVLERKKTEDTCLGSMTWVSAQIFVIDYFLWFMARHGYTLQPVRKDWEPADWSKDVHEMKEAEAKAFRAMLDEHSKEVGHDVSW